MLFPSTVHSKEYGILAKLSGHRLHSVFSPFFGGAQPGSRCGFKDR